MRDQRKPLCSVSLDLDNQWSYMKTHGDRGWKEFPSYLGVFVPRVLDILDRLDLKITVFVVGQDAILEKNREAISMISARGHEIGNHSFHHEPWLHLYPRDRIEDEIRRAEEQLIRVAGQKPIGFRGPGFSWSPALLEVLAQHGYVYDASILPTYIGPLARAYYFLTARLTEEEARDRAKLFGSISDGFKPVKVFCWQLKGCTRLLEIPVTTMPLFKVPFHLSYLMYLGRFSETLMRRYLDLAIVLCRVTGTEPSFLLHPLDLLTNEQVPELAFFPGMDLPCELKEHYFETVLAALGKHFDMVGMAHHAKAILGRGNPKLYDAA